MDNTDQDSVSEAVRRRAEGTLADLDERWDFERIAPLLVEPMPNHDSPTYPETADEFEDKFYPYAAGAVVANDNAELLCVRNPVREWETPGGAGELDEVPAETARRETLEETGIESEMTGVLFARLMNVDLGGPDPLPIPVIVFTAEPTGGSELSEGVDLTVREVNPGIFSVSELKIAAIETEHVMYCLAYRITPEERDAPVITYSGDSEAMSDIAEFADGSDILIHDCAYPDAVTDSPHATPAELGRVLASVQIDRTYLTHLAPETDGRHDEMLEAISEYYDGDVRIAHDWLEIEVN